jgi:DNA modification methylase
MRVSEEVIIGDCRLWHGDCLSVMRSMPENSVDAIVTDPPYGLSFMGNHWDKGLPSAELWAECLRVLKPGGHLLAFAGTRTQHRMATAIEDGGFEIRDMIAWVYGSGFPKSLDVSKAIDKAAGATREPTGKEPRRRTPRAMAPMGSGLSECDASTRYDDPATESARQWQGWGTALKPALEPITVARKPLIGTVAANVLEHGTGALNVDGCRVAHDEGCRMMAPSQANIDNPSEKYRQAGRRESVLELKPGGRWPANLIHDGSDDVFDVFPQSSGQQGALGPQNGDKLSINAYGDYGPRRAFYPRGDTGSYARFFYCAKASKSERGEGNIHPTVKPLALMRYLCRLVTPSGGVVLDPFLGSGSTAIAAIKEWFACVGIERELKYFDIACERIENAYCQAPHVPHVQTKQVQEALL